MKTRSWICTILSMCGLIFFSWGLLGAPEWVWRMFFGACVFIGFFMLACDIEEEQKKKEEQNNKQANKETA